MPALQVAPGTEDPTLESIMLAACTLLPSFNFSCLTIKCTPPELLAKYVSGLYFCEGF